MEILFWIAAIVVVVLIIFLLYLIFRSPFCYPYYTVTLDVSGKRSPKIYDLLDQYLIEHGFDEFTKQFHCVETWKTDCQKCIKRSRLKKLRTRQYEKAVDDHHLFQFQLTRNQTRYKQKNYVRTSYIVSVPVDRFSYSFEVIQKRYSELLKIGFVCTLSEYHAKDQRKRMTKALRDEIALRDNYTCRICHKYMPDGVGLHIDHIIPIAKGGKSVPSNLQVLCSKCNGKKSQRSSVVDKDIDL